jgi:hypothetical protein
MPKAKTTFYLQSPSKIDDQLDVRIDDFAPDSPPPSTATIHDPFNVPITMDGFRRDELKGDTTDASLPKTNPKKHRNTITMLPNNTIQALEFLSGRNTSTSTLFQDPRHSITIVLTTPDEELPDSFQPLPNIPTTRTLTTTSLPTVPTSNPTHLMPPPSPHHPLSSPNSQSHTSHDQREIRNFLISFFNTSSDQCPRALRRRMMAIYTIRPCDLDPATAARFEAEEDEGVAIEIAAGSEGIDHKESLRILGQAMRRRTEGQTPMRRPSISVPVSETAQIGQRNGCASSSRKTSPPRTLGTIPDDEEPPSTWLAPLISTSPMFSSSPRAGKKASSVPDLHGTKRPAQQATQSASAVPKLRSRESGGGLNVEEMRRVQVQTRGKRSGILKGVVGAVREVFGGRGR